MLRFELGLHQHRRRLEARWIDIYTDVGERQNSSRVDQTAPQSLDVARPSDTSTDADSSGVSGQHHFVLTSLTRH